MEWRCFHCDEVFTDRRCAKAHFGPDETSTPACRIKAGAEMSLLTALRRSEADCNEMMQRMQSETTDAATAYYAQMARHQEQLRIAEELGFERGIAELATADAAGFARGVEAGAEIAERFPIPEPNIADQYDRPMIEHAEKTQNGIAAAIRALVTP